MANKALYVLAGYDDETEKTLAGIQNRLYDLGFEGTQTKNIPMHFTLGSYDTEKEEELKARLKKAAKDHKAFKVNFTQIDLFQNPANDVLFITPEENKEMLRLKDDFSDNKDQYPWAAHTTMLIDKPEVIRDAKQVVLNEFKPFSGRVEKLYLYEFWPTRYIMTVQLETGVAEKPMDNDKIAAFIKKQKVAFICSVDEEGYPNVKAMLKPRKIEELNRFYFSTNTSSMRVKQYLNNPNACIYFYHKGLIKYTGVMLKGKMEVLTDQTTKEMIWHKGDTLFYKGGVTDPDYCVLKFTAENGRYYCDLKTENFTIKYKKGLGL